MLGAITIILKITVANVGSSSRLSLLYKKTAGCTHSTNNEISQPMVEYCNTPGLTRFECERVALTWRG